MCLEAALLTHMALPYLQVLDTGANLRYIPVGRLPAPSTNYTKTCDTLFLATLSGHSAYTGLSNGFRSDVSPDWTQGLQQICCAAVEVLAN